MHSSDKIITVTQGQFEVSDNPSVVLSTVLGSCIAACMFDRGLGVGGMNHFLLPGADPGTSNNVKYGAHSMEELINALLRMGALRSRLEVQLYGGGNVVKGIRGVGSSNADFARRFVSDEGLRLTKWDLGGNTGRKLVFRPAQGVAKVTRLMVEEAAPPRPAPKPAAPQSPSGVIELF